MKLLLVWPTQNESAIPGPPKVILNEAGAYPPMGLVQLATGVLKKGRHDVKIVDMILDNITPEKLEDIIRLEKPAVVGVTLNTLYFGDGYKVLRAVKNVSNDIITIVGGAHTTIYPKETIDIPEVDVAFVGEADFYFSDILDRLEEKKPVEDIPGVITKKSAELPKCSVSVDNLDDIPLPDRKLIKYGKYNSIISAANPVTIIMTSRGCPYKCAYCPAGGTKVRNRSVKHVADEVESCISLGIKDIYFFDELFTLNKARVKELCEEFKRRKLKFRWHIRARINDIDEALVELLAGSGCRLIQFGIESGTDKIQKVMKKNLDLAKVERVIKMTRDAGILTYGNFMIGSPTETREDIMKTVDFAARIKLDFAVFAITILLPGTEYYQMAFDQGFLKEDIWKKYITNPGTFIDNGYWPGEFTKEELDDLCKASYKKFYLRPAYVLGYFSRIMTLAQLGNHLKSGFKVFSQFAFGK
jgi:radical SAM superfamily enzyme YgiQ (UPF0313 family)